MKTKILGLFTSLALLFGLAAHASADVIIIAEAGQIFGGSAPIGTGIFCGQCSQSGWIFSGQAFALVYTFDTSAPGGSYTNNGSSSQLSGSFNGFLTPPSGSFVGSATIFSSGGVHDVFPASCNGFGCVSAESDVASAGSIYSQSVSLTFPLSIQNIQTALFANPAIPGSITTAFALSGANIGNGSFNFAMSPGVANCISFSQFCVSGNLQIGSIIAVATPLPAALPLFATGLGALGLLGWRRKRKLAA